MVRVLTLVLALALWVCGAEAASDRQPRVVFINPGAEHGADVWEQMPRFMGAAAAQLGIRLEVLYAERDRFRMVELARQTAARPPDYVVLVNEKERAPQMMEFFRGLPTRVLLLHNDLTPEQRLSLGDERGGLPNWIGTIVSNENAITGGMMEGLYRKSPGQPRIGGISGDEATPVSAVREAAVAAYVATAGRGEIVQVMHGNWERADATNKARALLRRYPDTTMIWAANDVMALGAVDAVAELKLGNTVLVGGMGAFPDALASIASGGLAVTVGGTAFAGAWAMVMIHDYDGGRDFAAANGTRLTSATVAIIDGPPAAKRFRDLLENPSRIDFRRFSLKDDPALKTYDFRYDAVLAAME